MDGTIAEIRMFAGNFAPRNWAYCAGQLEAISQNQALFSLVGTIYGGDGRTTFALPDFRGRAPVGTGHGPGLTNRVLGSRYGYEDHTLTVAEMPSHTHTAVVTGSPSATAAVNAGSTGTSNNPEGNYWGPAGLGQSIYSDSAAVEMASDAVQITSITGLGITNSVTGGSNGFSISQPSLVMNFIICVVGIYPSRN